MDGITAYCNDILALLQAVALKYFNLIKGTEKIIVDSLSIYSNISDQSLTKHFNSVLPHQTAASFHIKLPPIEITYWVFSLSASSTRPR